MSIPKMSKKKRHSSSNPPPPSPPPPADGPHSDIETVVQDFCDQCFDAFSRGIPKKALKIMKDALSRHPDSPALHRTQTLMYFHLSALSTGSEKLKQFQKCVSCAERTLSLIPNALGIHLLYADSLLSLAKEESDYRRVIEACEHALAIKESADPGLDVLLDLEGDGSEESAKENIKKTMKAAKVALLKCRHIGKVKREGFKDEGADKMVTLEEETKIQELRETELIEKMGNLRSLEKGRVFGGERREKGRNLGMKESLEYWNGRMSMEDKRRV